MGLQGVKNKKLLYHLTRLDNMESIIMNGLQPRRLLKNKDFFDVADANILDKRELLQLDQFVPFHSHPYSAFDVAVKHTYANEKFVYICIKRALAEFNDFKILVKHPLSQQECILYNYTEGINRIDWETMEKIGQNDDYTRNVKMAECLSSKCISPELFQCVYVPDVQTQKYIYDLFKQKGITEQPPYVSVQKEWF